MDVALIPAIGVTVALLGLAWTAYSTLSKRPRIHVELELHVTGTFITGDPAVDGPANVSPRIIVINRGGEACTIVDVGVCDTNGAPLIRMEREQTHGKDSSGKAVPLRIEAYGSEQWQIPSNRVDAEIEIGRKFLGFATTARPQRRWQPRRRRNQYRVYTSPYPEVRSEA